MRRALVVTALALLCTSGTDAWAQGTAGRPRTQAPRRPATPTRRGPAYPGGLQIRGFGMVGMTTFTASQTFDAVLDTTSGTEFGGGLSLTQGPAFLDIGARRFEKTGERVFVTDTREVFRLGIPATITMTPLDITAGWRLRPLFSGRLRPLVGVGYTRMMYEESSDFAESGEDVSESFNGFHVLGGGEIRLHRLVGLGAEVAWTSIADAIGENGASKAFGETNLGGTSARLKLVIGR